MTGKITSVRGGAGGSHPAVKPGPSQAVAFTGVSAQSGAAIGSNIGRFVSTTDCFLAFGANPTASASGIFLPAGKPEYFVCVATDKVAAVQASAGGTLYVTPAL
jgi:hypothetical protein